MAMDTDTQNVFTEVSGGIEFLKQLRRIKSDLTAQKNVMIAEGKASTGAFSTLRSLTKDIDDYFNSLEKGEVLLDDAIIKIGKGKNASYTADPKGDKTPADLGKKL